VISILILLGSLGTTNASVYYSFVKESQTVVSSPPVILENGTAGTSIIYTNNTSAKVSVDSLNWLQSWEKRVKITINSSDIDEALTDFPLLIYLSNSSSGEHSDDVSFIFDEIGSSRKKIAVTTSDGTTQCYVEIEKWNDANEQAWLWVRIPNISNNTETNLYLYYDSNHADNTIYVGDVASTPAQNVWNNNFSGIWHLSEGGTGTRYESTSHGNDGTTSGYDGDEATTWKIDGSDDLEGNDDYIYRADANLNGEIPCKSSGAATSFTISAWINIDKTGYRHPILVKQSDGSGTKRGFVFNVAESNVLNIEVWKDNSNAAFTNSAGTLDQDTWYHVMASYSFVADGASEVRLYINGSNDGSNDLAVGPLATNDRELRIGCYYWSVSYNRYFDGTIDEIRISNDTRSASWIKASYESERDDLLDFGSEERNVVDYVDNNTSDVGSPTDIGTHSNFTAQQYGPDSIYDTLTEEDTLGSWGNYSSELLINPGAEFGNTTGWAATGPNAASFDAGNGCPSGSAGPHTGSYAFYWNSPSSSSDWAYQEVDLSYWLSGIQSGEVQILAKGWLVCSEYHDPPWDIVRMRVVFYDNSSQEISSDTYDTGERGNLTSWTEFGVENYTIPTDAVKVRMWFQTYETGWDAGNADDYTVKVRTFRNYELDLEVQWTNANYGEENEELCIYGGTMDAENLRVDVRNGSKWENLFNDLSSGWNNISVSSYLTSSNFTIRFKGGNETGDTAQDSWNIDAALLHIWTTDAMTYDYVLRINNTVTDSWQIRLKEYSDSNINRMENCTIYFHNSTDGTPSQIIIENGSYINQTGPWYDLSDSETVYIAMIVQANSTGTSYVRTYLEILIPNTTTYAQYIITFEIT